MALDITDRLAIEDLVNRYCHNADYNPPESMRDLFVPEAIWEVPAMDLRCEGIDAIVAFFTQSRAGFGSARHVISNLVVEGDGDRATAACYLQVIKVDEDPKQIVSFGRYQDTLVRTALGWRLQHRMIAMG
jgi:hypothetical protein